MVLAVDKPVGFSSFQIVRLLQGKYRKVGHAGTLDPFASGLLIILTDQDTKRFQEFENCEKEYSGEVILGIETDTYDISGRTTTHQRSCSKPTRAMIEKAARNFVGVIKQVPPSFSALKHGGQKLYALSRKGVKVAVPARTVTVSSLTVRNYNYPVICFDVVAGRGVYVRSLAHDMGALLNTGATMLSLRRHRIGDYSVSDAHSMGALLQSVEAVRS